MSATLQNTSDLQVHAEQILDASFLLTSHWSFCVPFKANSLLFKPGCGRPLTANSPGCSAGVVPQSLALMIGNGNDGCHSYRRASSRLAYGKRACRRHDSG